MSNALQRILTALIAVPVVLGLAYLGGWPFGLLVLALALLAQHEMYSMMRHAGMAPYVGVGLGLGALVGLRFLVPEAVLVAIAAVPLFMAVSLFIKDERPPLPSMGATLLGVIYPTLLLTYLSDLRLGEYRGVDDEAAFFLTLAVFLLIWATDTFAYFVGKNLGKHPLAPHISPKKTWEGAAGGFVGALVVGIALKQTLLPVLSWVDVVALVVICGGFSRLGDLAESRMKRSVGVKDSGTILPGHGGVLDRFDAMIVAVPLVYLYLRYVPG